MLTRDQWFSASVSAVFLVLFFLTLSIASGEKQWTAGGDAISWEDITNWYPQAVPSPTDDVILDATGVNVLISRTFYAQTLKVGGRHDSNLAVADFVSGTISPASNTDDALYTRKGGFVTLNGDGIVLLKGSYKNSEETLSDEPAFMFRAE
jgi:hypothetical protein